MSPTQVEVSEVLGQLKELAPAGYALGFHIQYTTPKFMFQTYSKAWLDYYSQNGLLMQDPTLGWGFENIGAVRWSAFEGKDPTGVLKRAKEYGINYGITCATESAGSSHGIRSIGSFARSDRDFTDEEIGKISAYFDALHADTADQAELSDETIQQLKKMSVMVTHPGS